ncbi:MAG: hypothetical protein QM714_06345 [Nocardioides sp.]|uniref:hypothetical protein n=1 Tax=Nocardioides sp. TaxID=35761 RepID=UPI0039E6D99D
MSSPVPVRFPADLDRRVSSRARQSGRPKSNVVLVAVDEWLRMQDHPRVTFTANNLGERVPRVGGRMDVRVVVESWLAHDADERTVASVADATGLDPIEVSAALAYWADYPDEIDRAIALQEEATQTAYASWERRRSLGIV